ncbi:ABC transporter ATP-binding protein [Alphaproteobacteria bacterium]|nr:ABC transporter ATP-binding protein [Alphaproteobacteria bacterium]
MPLKLIDANNLKKSFGNFVAVDNIDLAVNRGEVVGFLGPNGAGKSTTMKMLTGFLEPDSGDILINNINLKSHPLEAKQFIGYLPEGAPSYSDMEVSEFLSFVGKMRGINNKNVLDSRLDDMANQINLKDVWDRPIETLSKGFKRRVGIAQALIHDPDILILDEPTDGLDPNQKHEMRNLIKTISKNKAIVISTHILEEVEAVCSRAVIIANGKLLANEKPVNLGKNIKQQSVLSIVVSSKINNTISKEIKANLDYKNVEIQSVGNSSGKILIQVDEENLDLNKIITQLKKQKLNVVEAFL